MSRQCQIKITIICYVCVLWILVVSTNIPYGGHPWSTVLNIILWHTITWNIYTWVPLSHSTTSCHMTRGFPRLRSITRLSFSSSHMWTSTHAHEGEHQGIMASQNQLNTQNQYQHIKAPITNMNTSRPQMLPKNPLESKMKLSPTSRQRCLSPLMLLKLEHHEQSNLYGYSKK